MKCTLLSYSWEDITPVYTTIIATTDHAQANSGTKLKRDMTDLNKTLWEVNAILD
jgi:hypothetical protein